MAVDYLSALNVGSGLNVTQIVDAIVDAERVPQENIIQRRIDEKTVSVSALGQLKGNFASLDKNLEGMDGKTGLVTSSSSTAVTVEETGTFDSTEVFKTIALNQGPVIENSVQVFVTAEDAASGVYVKLAL